MCLVICMFKYLSYSIKYKTTIVSYDYSSLLILSKELNLIYDMKNNIHKHNCDSDKFVQKVLDIKPIKNHPILYNNIVEQLRML